MTVSEWIITCVLFLSAAVCAVIAARHYAEKGFLFNNAYLYATRGERERMDKKPYYRQSAVVFTFLCPVFLLAGLSVLLQNTLLCLGEIPLLLGALVYAVVSSAHSAKDGKR